MEIARARNECPQEKPLCKCKKVYRAVFNATFLTISKFHISIVGLGRFVSH